MKKLIVMLTIAFAMIFASGSVAEAATKTITIKKANTSTLKKVDKELKKGKKLYLKVKGSKSGSKKLIKSVSSKIGQTNGYSVKFNYGSQKRLSQGYYRFTVSADNAKLYKYTVALLKDMYTREQELTETFWNENKTKSIVDGNRIVDITEAGWDTRIVVTSHKKQNGNKPFYKLSTCMQSAIIGSNFDDNGSKYITYEYKAVTDKDFSDCDFQGYKGYSNSELMLRLLKGQAQGVCGDFAQYQMLIFDQIGLTSYLAASYEDANHGVAVVKVKNSNGKVMWVCYDMGGACTFKAIINHWGGNDWSVEGDKKLTKKILNNTWDYETDFEGTNYKE